MSEWTKFESGWFQTRSGEKAFVVPSMLTENSRPYGGSVRVEFEDGGYTSAYLTTFEVWGWKRCDPPQNKIHQK